MYEESKILGEGGGGKWSWKFTDLYVFFFFFCKYISPSFLLSSLISRKRKTLKWWCKPKKKSLEIEQMSIMPDSRYRSLYHLFLSPSQPSFSLFLFFFFSTLTSLPSAAANNEVSVLSSWLHSSDSNLHLFSEWTINADTPCNWTYITCNPQGFVSEINIQSISLQLPLPNNLPSLKSLQKLIISGANLTGHIPDTLSTSLSLRVIDLSFNSLTGSIPPSIGNLPGLQDLILNSNQLTGKIPVEISQCSKLRNLVLFDNSLSGTIPGELGLLSSLEVLRAGGNKDIAGEIPVELGNCGNLTVLGLADTHISGSIPTSLGKLKKLQTLSIYTTMLSGEIPADLGNCSELVDLYLYENDLSGSIPPEEIGNCSSIVSIDVALNFLSGAFPQSIGGLFKLQELMVSNNNLSGSIPSVISNATSLIQLQLDTNQISGLIPTEIGYLSNLIVFLAWDNNLEGSIPSSLARCINLQSLDLSHNSLTGSLPAPLFLLKNLTKLLLISNDISGSIPPEIGSCSSLVRVRVADNRIAGQIPKEIGGLKRLNFLDLSGNRLTGQIPDEIGNCGDLEMLDLSRNALEGELPGSLSSLSDLQVLDASNNRFSGGIPTDFGRLGSLSKLVLRRNSFSGLIPPSIGKCSNLQLLDLSGNELSGNIPVELCMIEALEIALNLSFNGFSGSIPSQISSLNRLSILDLSHNKLDGDLRSLAGLDNLVSLNVSYNNFTGYLPDNKLFRQLSSSELAGNRGLCSSPDSCFARNNAGNTKQIRRSRAVKVALALLVALTVVMVIIGVAAVIRLRRSVRGEDDSEIDSSPYPWQITPFQKFNFSIDQISRCLVTSNVIGKGGSGIVYRAEMDDGEVIAVKKLWPMASAENESENKCGLRDSFSAEVKTLGSIRHKNIIRFLGCCWNRKTRLLMYDYMPNGSLGSVLHERNGSNQIVWELRYQILLGAARGLGYLHHDCVPPIVHRDIKANNILIGLEFEAYIADFGLAKLVEGGDFARSSNTIAGSYGYIAPEYGYMMKITEKSDVYSYGVVMLEILTGKQPIDPTIPDGLHVVDWVRKNKGGIEVLDSCLREDQPESEIDEMRQALGVAMLCVNSTPEDRPTMKDVAAMLEEIRYGREEYLLAKGSSRDHCQGSTNSLGVLTGSSSDQFKPMNSRSGKTSLSSSSSLLPSQNN